MTAITLRSQTLAAPLEVTEGTPVAPASGSDFIDLQSDVTFAPNRETLASASLTGSIGQAKPITGIETPTMSFSKYLTHSGVEGQEPQYGTILEALFGDKNVYVASEATVASATVSTITVGGGEGANFANGYAVLIKDSINGYKIRQIIDVTGDVLTLNFNLPAGQAPGAGVKLGIPITYLPANSGHPTLTLWNYLSGGATQMMTGSRPTNWALTADAGQLINGNFTFEGNGYYFDPILVTAGTSYIDFTDDDGTAAIQIAAKYYKDPGQLATAITTAFSNATTQTIVCTYDDINGEFIFSTDTSAVLSLLWNTGANTANTIGAVLGFSTAADDTGSLSYTSDNAQTFDPPFTPVYDVVDPLAAKNQQVLLGLAEDNVCFDASTISISPSQTKTNILSICAETGVKSSLISARNPTITLTALLDKYQQKEFQRFRTNQTIRFQYSFGTKNDGTNWDAGFSGCWSSSTCVISSLQIVNVDDIARISITLTPFVENGKGELFLNFL